jgi:hypothetical protein
MLQRNPSILIHKGKAQFYIKKTTIVNHHVDKTEEKSFPLPCGIFFSCRGDIVRHDNEDAGQGSCRLKE